eukprot:800557-Prymnesium_polylepis.2
MDFGAATPRSHGLASRQHPGVASISTKRRRSGRAVVSMLSAASMPSRGNLNASVILRPFSTW